MCGARGNDSPYTGIITSMSDILHQLHYQDTKFLDLWFNIGWSLQNFSF